MSDYSVRQAISSDITALIAFDHGYSTDHVWQMSFQDGSGQVAVTFREVRLPRPMRVTYPRNPERLADEWTSYSIMLVAEKDAELLGYLTLGVGPAQQAGWMMDLVTSLRYRRQGIATNMVGMARKWCKERELSQMFMEMQSKNYPAICLARKLGFVFAGYSDRYYQDQDIAVFFSLDL
jgi:ribosomal protein S18 acetylase RimI-like enzyme